MKRLLFLSVLLLLVLFGLAEAGQIYGNLRYNNRPIKGVVLNLMNGNELVDSAKVDKNGFFALRSSLSGELRIELEIAEEKLSVAVTVPPGRARVNLQLTKTDTGWMLVKQ